MINFFKESERYDESYGLINDDKMTKKNFESSSPSLLVGMISKRQYMT